MDGLSNIVPGPYAPGRKRTLKQLEDDYAAFQESGWEYDWERWRCVKGDREGPLTPECVEARISEAESRWTD